jgi:hypothetical protein
MGAGSFEAARDRGRRPSAVERAHHAEGGAVDELGVEQALTEGGRQGGFSGRGVGAFGDPDALSVEVDVRDPEREALGEAEATAVKDFGDEAEGRVQGVEEGLHLASQEGGRAWFGEAWARAARDRREREGEDVFVEEDDGVEGLSAGGRRAALRSEPVEEGGNLQRAHPARVAARVSANEGQDPAEVGLAGARGEAAALEGAPDGFDEGHGALLREAGASRGRRGGPRDIGARGAAVAGARSIFARRAGGTRVAWGGEGGKKRSERRREFREGWDLGGGRGEFREGWDLGARELPGSGDLGGRRGEFREGWDLGRGRGEFREAWDLRARELRGSWDLGGSPPNEMLGPEALRSKPFSKRVCDE